VSTLLSSTVLIPHPYSNNLVHRQERRFARQRYLIFDTLRTRTTTLDELNEDEPGNADAPPHHHGKLTTRTTTRRRRGGAQGNRRTRRRRGRHHRLGTRVRAEDDDSKHLDMELLHRNHGNRAATLGRGGGRYDLRRQEQVAATGCAGCDERRRLCCETRTEQQTGERRRRRTAQALVRRSYCRGEAATETGSGRWCLRQRQTAARTGRGDGNERGAAEHSARRTLERRVAKTSRRPGRPHADAAAAGAPRSGEAQAQGARCGEGWLRWARGTAATWDGDAGQSVARRASSSL
jgi:hypothetical protein